MLLSEAKRILKEHGYILEDTEPSVDRLHDEEINTFFYNKIPSSENYDYEDAVKNLQKHYTLKQKIYNAKEYNNTKKELEKEIRTDISQEELTAIKNDLITQLYNYVVNLGYEDSYDLIEDFIENYISEKDLINLDEDEILSKYKKQLIKYIRN